jgi:hypothetical protein
MSEFARGVIAAIRVIESTQPPEPILWECTDMIKRLLLDGYEQPTVSQLKQALSEVYACAGFRPSQAAAIADLRVLREKKHTWVGAEENELRFLLDDVLYEFNHSAGKGGEV